MSPEKTGPGSLSGSHAAIYQRCRRTDEIQVAFDQLQLELNFEIHESISSTRQKLLENFDDEVREKLKVRDEDSKAYLSLFSIPGIPPNRRPTNPPEKAPVQASPSFISFIAAADIGGRVWPFSLLTLALDRACFARLQAVCAAYRLFRWSVPPRALGIEWSISHPPRAP